MLYSWFALATLLFFLLLIGRFYERFSAERTHFRLFAFPAALFGVAVIRYTSLDIIAGDTFGDLLSALGGIILITLCVILYRRMILGRKPNIAHYEDDHADFPS